MKWHLEHNPVDTRSAGNEVPALAPEQRIRLRRFGVFVLALSLGFSKPLYDLAVFAAGSELYSHIILIPFVSLFLVWLQRNKLPSASPPSPGLAAVPIVGGALALLGFWLMVLRGAAPGVNNSLSVTILSYVAFLAGGGFLFLGRNSMREISFPFAFLIFMIPFPVFLTNWLEIFFQHTSAYVSYLLLALSNTPMLHDGLMFRLPGITIAVAQECSGIHSSLVLFITSLLAGHLFLVSPWKTAALALFIVPLAIARNAFRIVTIALLCVYDDPSWIDSALHRRGGPLFFALSLIPLFLLLLLLRRPAPAWPMATVVSSLWKATPAVRSGPGEQPEK